MNDLQLLVSVTISEFEVLRDFGAFQVDPSRIILTRASGKEGYGAEVDTQLLAKLPEIRPAEDHSVVILAFTGWPAGHPPVAEHLSPRLSGRVTLSARDCSQVIPLTSRAQSILAGRLQGQVILGPPLFEDLIEGHLKRLDDFTSFTGAQAILESLVTNYEDFQNNDVSLAIKKLDRGMSSLLHSMLKFTRHKPMPREPISGLRDLGGLLKDTANVTGEEALKNLKGWLRTRKDKVRGFPKVYGDPELGGILNGIKQAWDLPTPAASLAIFLHWRDLALHADGVDLRAIGADCRKLGGFLDGQVVADALWLLGFSAGFESIAPGYYQRLGERHPFNPGGSPGKRVTLLKLAPIPQPESKPNSKSRTGATSESVPEPKRETPDQCGGDEPTASASNADHEPASKPKEGAGTSTLPESAGNSSEVAAELSAATVSTPDPAPSSDSKPADEAESDKGSENLPPESPSKAKEPDKEPVAPPSSKDSDSSDGADQEKALDALGSKGEDGEKQELSKDKPATPKKKTKGKSPAKTTTGKKPKKSGGKNKPKASGGKTKARVSEEQKIPQDSDAGQGTKDSGGEKSPKDSVEGDLFDKKAPD